MEIKIFNNKKIKIRKLLKKDLGNVRRFQDFFNSLVVERALILADRKLSLKQQTERLKNMLKKIGKSKCVCLVAEEDNKIIGQTAIFLRGGRQRHVGELLISIRKENRGMGLGDYLIKKIILLAKKELKPKPKIIRLDVFSTNKPAIGLYRKCGFKRVARVPKQIKYKGKLIDEIIMLLYL